MPYKALKYREIDRQGFLFFMCFVWLNDAYMDAFSNTLCNSIEAKPESIYIQSQECLFMCTLSTDARIGCVFSFFLLLKDSANGPTEIYPITTLFGISHPWPYSYFKRRCNFLSVYTVAAILVKFDGEASRSRGASGKARQAKQQPLIILVSTFLALGTITPRAVLLVAFFFSQKFVCLMPITQFSIISRPPIVPP